MGCGWFGISLAKAFINNGLIVKGSTTSADKLQSLANAQIEPFLINFLPDNDSYDPHFFECDILWICIPPKIRAGKGGDYSDKIRRIISLIISYKIKQVIFISSTGVYGDVNADVNELSETKPDNESGKAMLLAEELLKQQTDFTTTIIRFAGLIGPGRDPGRFFAGKKAIPNGKAPVNLIHLTDCIGISQGIMNNEAFGYTYNACSPSHPEKADFYTKAAKRSGLELPEFIDELKSWKTVSGSNVNRLLNYEYQIADLMSWLSAEDPFAGEKQA